jgi:hypothetical protein
MCVATLGRTMVPAEPVAIRRSQHVNHARNHALRRALAHGPTAARVSPAAAVRLHRSRSALDPRRCPVPRGAGDVCLATGRRRPRARHARQAAASPAVAQRNELGYLLRALKNTYSSRYRTEQRRPQTRQLLDHDAPASPAASVCSREILEAIASAPAVYRDAVIAVDLLGLSYREAAHSLGTSEATLTTRLHRGRQRIASQLITETTTAH